MKNLITFLLSLVTAFAAGAVTFSVDGINYNLLSSKDLTCEVIAGDYSGDIVIPETVSYGNKDITVLNIADNAFYECAGMTSVKLPNTIRIIGKNAFYGCSGLTSLSIPGSVSQIKKGFACCGIRELRFETLIPWETGWHSLEFGEATDGQTERLKIFQSLNLEKLYIDRMIPTARTGSAYDHYSSIAAPFKYMNTIKEVEFGENCESGYFTGCKGLTTVKIPATGKFMISDFAFLFCENLESIEGLENVVHFGKDALPSMMLPDFEFNPAVEAIGTGSFAGTDIKRVVIPNTTVVIWDEAFLNCQQLVTVELHTNNLKSGIFSGCENIKDLTFGAEVTTRYIPDALKGGTAPKIKNLHIQAPVPPDCFGGFDDDTYVTAVLHVLPESLEAYKAANVWKDFWNIVGDEVAGTASVVMAKSDVAVNGHTIRMTAEDGNALFYVYDSVGMCVYAGGPAERILATGVYLVVLPDGTTRKLAVN